MTILVAVFGVVIAAFGAIGIVSPARLREIIGQWPGRSRFWFAIIVRLLLGALFVWLADDLRYSLAMRILGGISIAAAIGIMIMGRERLDRLVAWWLALGDPVLRVSMLLAMLFGALLVHVSF